MSVHPAAPVIWDTTGPRHLAIAGRTDVFFSVARPHVPRVVADPDDPYHENLLSSSPDCLSEFAAAERHFLMRYRRGGDVEDWQRSMRLAELRRHPGLVIVDLGPAEAEDMMIMSSQAFANRHGLLAPLGRGECATLAAASNRSWIAGLDDRAARTIADYLYVETMTTQDLLRAAVAGLILTPIEAKALNQKLIDGGFRGDPQLDI